MGVSAVVVRAQLQVLVIDVDWAMFHGQVVQLSAIWDASARDSLRPDRISTSPSFRRTPEWARWDRVSPGRSRLDSLAAVSALGVHREDVNDWSSAS